MGWYSKHIMGGDEPSDAMDYIKHQIGFKADEKFVEVEEIKSRVQKLTDMQDALLKWAKKTGGKSTVAVQVLGVAMMRYGAAIKESTMQALLNACDQDGWAKEDLERAIFVREFKSILQSYDNATPTEETIDHLARFGVTNEDWINGRMSSRVAKMSLHYVHNAYKDEPWYKDTTLGVSSNGYSIIMGVKDDPAGMNFKHVIHNVFGLFEVPIVFMDATEMQYVSDEVADRVKYHGDINYQAPGPIPRKEVFKSTTDDWYPNYPDNQVKLVYVGELADGKYRVCIWGQDDCGMERDFMAEAHAYGMFQRLTAEPVINFELLKKLGFYRA